MFLRGMPRGKGARRVSLPHCAEPHGWWLLRPGVVGLLSLVFLSVPPTLWAQSRIIPRSPTSPPAQGTPPGANVARPVSPAGPVNVSLQENRLSVEARDGDLRTVIERIATQGNIEVRHLDGLPSARVSVRFADMAVAEGLKRLFRVADVSGYALVTETVGANIHVRRILFLPPAGGPTGLRPVASGRRPPMAPPPSGIPMAPPAEPAAESQQAEGEQSEGSVSSSGGSVLEDLKANTTARRLLSQLVHPNEQVRERALESLIQLVGDDQRQAQLLEFLEPLMDDMTSDDKAAREEARAEIRKLLSR